MSEPLDGLKAHDAGMAKIYSNETKGRAGAIIDKALAEKLFKYAFKDNTITGSEASALDHLLIFGNFKSDAKIYLLGEIFKKVKVEERFEKKPPSKDLLREIAYALSGAVVSKIQFISPYTNISYSPKEYAVAGKLIADQEIEVQAIDSGAYFLWLKNGGSEARYDSEYDTLLIPNWEYGYPKLYPLVVHECTHLIQDWLDKDDLDHWGVETDAWIAGALAAHASKAPPDDGPKNDPPIVAYRLFGEFLRKNFPLVGKKFNDACAAVYKAVSESPNYKPKKGLKYAEVVNDRMHFTVGWDTPEKDYFADALNKLYNSAKKAKVTP